MSDLGHISNFKLIFMCCLKSSALPVRCVPSDVYIQLL